MVGGCHVKPEQIFNLIFGYNEQYIDSNEAVSTGLTWTITDLTTVPSDEVWLVNAITAFHSDSVDRETAILVYDGTNSATVRHDLSLPQWVRLQWRGMLVLGPGMRLRMQVKNLVSGQSVYGTACGCKMKLSQ